MKDPAGSLLQLTVDYLPRARCPYSGMSESAVVLLSDGTWVPGVRVESASFSLVIDALVNAVSTAVACGRTDIIAVALGQAASESQSAYLHGLNASQLAMLGDRLFVANEATALPDPTAELNPTVPAPDSDGAGVLTARQTAERAFTPESSFPVGCVAVTDSGAAVPGVNVEHADWNRIICAERNALGTAVSYDLGTVHRLYLSCPQDSAGSPCGACRQVLAELAPGSTILMDRGPDAWFTTTPEDLLPASFTGNALLRRRSSASRRPPQR